MDWECKGTFENKTAYMSELRMQRHFESKRAYLSLRIYDLSELRVQIYNLK